MDPLLKRMAELEARVDAVEGKDGAGSLAAQAEALAALQGQLAASEELMMSKITQLGTDLAHSKQDALLAAKSASGEWSQTLRPPAPIVPYPRFPIRTSRAF